MEKEQLQELIENNKEDIFSEIKDEISDDTVTDIEWDGYNLWITQLGRGCYISMKELSDRYMDNLSIRLANIMGASFNRMHPILEANTESLRISIWHESRCGRKSMAIRKIPRKLRFGHGDLVKSDYAPESIITLLENCVTAHLSTVLYLLTLLTFPYFQGFPPLKILYMYPFPLFLPLWDNYKGKFIIQLFNRCLPLYQEVLRKSALLPL